MKQDVEAPGRARPFARSLLHPGTAGEEADAGLIEPHALHEDRQAYDADNDPLWAFVQSAACSAGADDEEDGSMVLVSRASSPWPVELRRAQSPLPEPVQVNWPPSLPWLQFQVLYLKKAVPQPWRQCLGQGRYKPLWTGVSAGRHVIREDAEVEVGDDIRWDDRPGLDATSLITAMGCRAFSMVERDAELGRVAAEISKSVPETHEGEHEASLRAMLSGDADADEARLAVFKMLVYQVSNDLVDYSDDDEDNKYERIVTLFRNTGLPSDTWVEHFTQKRDRSSKAFAEKLFEAAVNAQDLEVVEALLKSGIDPNQPIISFMNCFLERPIQVAADNRVGDIRLARLLIQHGADVDLTTHSNERPALHTAAESGTLAMVRLLVESGADIYQGYMSADGKSPVGCAVDRMDRWTCPNTCEGDGFEPESEGMKILLYLAGLHQKGDSPEKDARFLQKALGLAAAQAHLASVRVLHDAGGDPSLPCRFGITPLLLAASNYSDDTRVVSYLLDQGAPINAPTPRLAALHVAAARGHRKVVALLIERGAHVNASAVIVASQHYLLGANFSPAEKTGKGRYTPLQLALHRTESPLFGMMGKTDEAAIALLEAGAQLVGGELILAARFLSRRLVGALLGRGANPHARDSAGCHVLQMALRSQQLRGRAGENISDILLDAGVTLDKRDSHLAFAAGDLQLAKLLFDIDAPYFKDAGPRGESLLEAALCSQSRLMVDWALSTPGIQYSSGALCAAVCLYARGDKTILDRVLGKRGTGSNASPMLEATAASMLTFHTLQCGEKHVPLTLISLLEDMEGPHGDICLHPFPDNYTSYVNLMRGTGVHSLAGKYNELGWWRKPGLIHCSPLVPVMSMSMPAVRPILGVLLGAGYRPDGLCLLLAVIHCSEKDVEYMINNARAPSYGARAVSEAVRHDMDTPLQAAVRRGRAGTVQLLLHKHGADVNGLPPVLVPSYTPSGDPNEFKPRSALQMAVEAGDLEIIELLLAAGAHVNGPMAQDGGATALQCAAAKGYIGIARSLIERGAHVNAPRAERYGRTALEAAAEWGRLDVVQYLLEEGADTTSEDEGIWQFLRAIGFADRNGHMVVAGLLRAWRRLDAWERRSLMYHGLLDEVFEAPDDDLLFELLGCYEESESDGGEEEGHHDSGLPRLGALRYM